MVSFALSLIALLLGYVFYSRLVVKVFQPDDRPTPAVTMADGIDYVPMPTWKIFMIQFLNIAGTGPIFGAIMGAWYGPAAYLWIVFGCIFAGAVHDYFSGMLSMRHGGRDIPELVGAYLGKKAKAFMLFFATFLLVMVGVVFVFSPALILGDYCLNTLVWVGIIFVYYLLATLLPIDKMERYIPSLVFPCSSWPLRSWCAYSLSNPGSPKCGTVLLPSISMYHRACWE